MKKMILAPLALLASVAVAAVSLPELNANLDKLLAPINDGQTVARVIFSNIKTNSERALSLRASALYRKVGSQNTLGIDIKNVSYEYGDGSAPTTYVTADLDLDLTKVIGQETLNEIIPSVEGLIQDVTKSLTEDYGEAVSVVTEISNKEQDGQGNFTAIKGAISFKIDASKLPASKPLSEVPLLAANLIVDVKLAKGTALSVTATSNPAYKGFQKENEGLKEYLDALLNEDAKKVNEIASFISRLNEAAAGIVEQNGLF